LQGIDKTTRLSLGMVASPQQPDAAHQVLEARVAAQRIVDWVYLQGGESIGML